MNWRNTWRFLNRAAGSLTVFDTGLPEMDRQAGPVILFSCHDVDRSMKTAAGRRFSPVLDSIRGLVAELGGWAPANLSHPYAVYRGGQVEGGAITLNQAALGVRLRSIVQARLKGQDPQAVRLEQETALYRDLLLRLRPQLLLCIQPPPALCRAARALGLAVVEAMHTNNISLNDQVFTAHMARPDELLPTHLISFDAVSQATLEVLCKGRSIEPLQAPDPWLHRLRREQALATSGRRDAAASAPRARNVIVTLQWGYDGERESLSNIIPNGVLHPALEALFEQTQDTGLRFQLRMHPVQMNAPGYRHHRRHIESMAARFPHVECERASTLPLPVLLDEASAHLTMSSSAVGEAAVAGVPSLMLCPTLKPGGAHGGFFRELEASGSVTFGELDVNAIRAWVDACPPAADRATPPYDFEARHAEALAFYARLIERTRASAVAVPRSAAGAEPMCREAL